MHELADIGALQARSLPESTDYNLSDIDYNLSDIGALQARSSPESTDYNLSDIDNRYFASLPAWPCLLSPPSPHDDESDHPWFTPNLAYDNLYHTKHYTKLPHHN